MKIIFNHLGEIIAAKVITGNIDDRNPVSELAKDFNDKLYAVKGCISKAFFSELFDDGVDLVTTVSNN